MAKEFDKIMQFFNLSPEDKAASLKDVFDASIDFFERFKHIMQNGTPEEKKIMVDEVMKMQQALQDETKKITESTGMDEDKLKTFAQNPSNFTDEQWRIIQDSKSKIETQAEEILSIVQFKPPGGPVEVSPPTSSTKKKPNHRKGGWVRS